MASQIITVDDLIKDCRSLLDEDNRASVKDDEDILPALNRAQNYASNILSRHYESPMITNVEVETVAGQEQYIIPEDAFEQRVEKVEIKVNQVYYSLKRIDYRDISSYDNRNSTSTPYYYCVIGTEFRLLPASNGNYPLRIWYSKDPAPLVKQQGRINIVNAANNYVIVDNIGDDITTESDQLASYVNVIDAQTGIRKATFQIKNINGNQITFKTTPLRSSVLNINIDSDINSLLLNDGSPGPDLVIQPDDYICLIQGSCVPFFKKPFSNFLIQYAVGEIRSKLGEQTDMDKRTLEELEKQVERSWVGREQSLRVKKSNEIWGLRNKRRFWGGN